MSVLRGTIAYVRDDTGRQGRDDFTLTHLPDDSWLVNARTTSADTGILREVIHLLDPGHRPVSSHIVQWRHGEPQGDGWLTADERGVHASVAMAGQGRLEQHLRTPTWPAFIVPHAVVCDAFITATYDRDRGGRQPIVGGVRSSPRADGTTGPLGSVMDDLALTLLGEESIDVPAGRFATDHYLVESDGGAVEHLWITPSERLLVRLRSDRLATTYEIDHLESDA